MTDRSGHISALVFCTLSLVLCTWSPLAAQSFVGPTIGGNMVQTVDDLRSTHALLSGGGEAGFAYEWQREHLLVRTGVGYSFQCPSLKLDSQWLEQDMLDTRGVPVVYRGLLDARTDRLFMHQLTIPLMVGGTWYGAYVLVGLKMSVALGTSARQDAALCTAGDYQGRYYEWFEDMPNHGYHDFEPVQTRHAVTLNRFDLRLAAELGYTFQLNPYSNRHPSPLLRAGLFAEYGIFNLHTRNSTDPRTTADWTQYLQVSMTHIYSSEESNTSRAHLFLAGLRFTLLFPVTDGPSTKVFCHCE